MEQYNHVAQLTAQLITNEYSSSFGLATRAFPAAIRKHIYNIYGLVRIADEIVDSYDGDNQRQQLDDLEREVYAAIKRHYSSNITVHAFQLSAVEHGITKDLIAPFFDSMRTDIDATTFTAKQYTAYIHGSAEVVGLMCLRVFVKDTIAYGKLQAGAAALGAAFQKVNFLRDIAFDHNQLHRFYFPGRTFETFDEAAKHGVVADTYADFVVAKEAIDQLPKAVRAPVLAAYRYFYALLQKLDKTSVTIIKNRRVRINNGLKLAILTKTVVRHTPLLGIRK